jgi:hypothetical protein
MASFKCIVDCPFHLLTSTLTHLSTLAAKTTHTLLLPLFTHTCFNVKNKGKSVLIFKTVSSKGSSLKSVGTVYEADEIGRNEFLVLNHSLESVDGGAGLNVVGGRSGCGGYENLHGYVSTLVATRPVQIRIIKEVRDKINGWLVAPTSFPKQKVRQGQEPAPARFVIPFSHHIYDHINPHSIAIQSSKEKRKVEVIRVLFRR